MNTYSVLELNYTKKAQDFYCVKKFWCKYFSQDAVFYVYFFKKWSFELTDLGRILKKFFEGTQLPIDEFLLTVKKMLKFMCNIYVQIHFKVFYLFALFNILVIF